MANVPMEMEAFEKKQQLEIAGFQQTEEIKILNFVTNTVASERWRWRFFKNTSYWYSCI